MAPAPPGDVGWNGRLVHVLQEVEGADGRGSTRMSSPRMRVVVTAGSAPPSVGRSRWERSHAVSSIVTVTCDTVKWERFHRSEGGGGIDIVAGQREVRDAALTGSL